MSSERSNGNSIVQAVELLKETYRNLNVFFNELDRVGEEEGYVAINQRFMRYKSDTNHDGWLISNFTKLYVKATNPPASIDEIRNLPWYGVIVDLEGEEEQEIPLVSIVRYQFDTSVWDRLPSVTDFWVFNEPFSKSGFDITYENGEWLSIATEKAKKSFYGFEKAKAVDIPLFSVTSPEDLREKVIHRFDRLTL